MIQKKIKADKRRFYENKEPKNNIKRRYCENKEPIKQYKKRRICGK